MAKLKIENVLSFLSSEFGNPAEIKDYAEYLATEKVVIGENNDYSDAWDKLIKIKNVLSTNNLTLEEYKAVLSEKGKVKTTRQRAPKVSIEELLSIECWTNEFYEKAYDIVKDRKYPIVIPSYNRPNCKFLEWVNKIMIPDYEWPIYIVVRESQKDLYLNSEYVKHKPYISIKAFPDETIDDIGKTREKIVSAFSKKFDNIFMWDDDITNFCHTVPVLRPNGEYKNRAVGCNNFGKSIAMWQIAHEYAVAKYNIVCSTGMLQAFSWVPEFAHVDRSLRVLSGLLTVAYCLNLKQLVNNNLNFRTQIGNGHEDLDLYIRCLLADQLTAEFRWFTFSNPGMGTEMTGANSLQERFTKQRDEMRANFGDVEFVKWHHTRGLDNVGINWRKLRLRFKERNIIDLTDKNYEDLWRDGKLLEDATNNYMKCII